MNERVPSEIEQAVANNHGMVQLPGEHQEYVVMTKELYREVLGTEDEEEAKATIEAIQRGMADIEAGRTKPAKDFFAEFDRQHGIQD